MALTLVTGRANSGKTGAVYDALMATVGPGRPVTLLLPTHPDVRRATAELSLRCPVGLHVEQLDRWAAGLWSLFGDGRLPIETEQRALLLAEAAEAAGLTVLRRSAETPGFRRFMSYVVRRASEEPRETLERLEPRSRAEAEVASLLREYGERAAAAGLIEPAEATRLLAREPPPAGALFVHRFSDLSASQEALLMALAAREDVWISLPWEEAFAPTEALDALAGRLADAATVHHRVPVSPKGPPELARLEALLFQAPEPAAGEGRVRFCTAAGVEAEAVLIAEQAAEASRAYGPDRVAIVFRDAARHVHGLRVSLAGAGIPADLDVLMPVARTPFGCAVQRVLRAAAGAGDRAALLGFLRSPSSGIAQDEVDRMDARWRAAPGGTATAALAEAGRTGPGVGRTLKLAKAVTSRPLSSRRLPDWKELADRLLACAHGAYGFAADSDAELDAAAHRSLLDAVTRLTEIGSGRLGHQDVLAALDEATVAPASAERPGHVQVTEAHRLRSRRFDAVIVGGLTAGDFSAEGRTSAAADIADRLLGTERASEQAQERLLFYNVCTRARERLVLVRQTADSDGTPVRPSVFWEEALDLYREPVADARAGEEAAVVGEAVRLSDLDRAAPSLTPGRARLRAQASGGAFECEPAVAAAIARAARGTRELADPETLASLASRDEFSVTELEVYARCPYRWFYERMVRPETLDVSFNALSRGALAHQALAAFYTALPERLGVRRVTPDVLGDALSLADEAFERSAADPSTPARTTLSEEDDFLTTVEQVRGLVARDQHFLPGFEPAAAELRFGEPRADVPDRGGAGPVEIGGVKLRGSIDRVDVGEPGLVVIDYKSGTTVPKRADFERDRVLQVPLYAAAASAILGRPAVAGLYRSLKTGASRGFYLRDAVETEGLTSTDALSAPEQVEALIAVAVAQARDAVDGIRAGAIPAEPTTPDACRYCAAASVCRRGA